MKSGDLVVSKTTGVHGIVLAACDSKVFAESALSYLDAPDNLMRVLFHGKNQAEAIMASALRKVNV